MNGIAETGLWLRSLGAAQQSPEAQSKCEQLVTALEGFRERAGLLAERISHDHPDFTLHDSTHFDALWGLADQIAGPDYELTPTEAFVFGGAALIHDLGMASAAYTDGGGSLEDDSRWRDRLAFFLRQSLDRSPTDEEMAAADPEIVQATQEALLRELHAERAEKLAMASWTDADGDQYQLLESKELRKALGPVIGRVAHSHWWAPSVLADRLGEKLGAPAGCPAEWTVRPLIVACLLRLADASHLDASRAPGFLRALRPLSAKAASHWDFQARLSQPYPQGDRFVFTGSAFDVSKAEAWWLCAEMLKTVDREMRSVDALLSDRSEPRFAIRGVVGVDDLARLVEYVPTEGWSPADIQVRISDVVRLVERLGGRELYGARPHVPLRELLQNAADSVRAARVIERRDPEWGKIVVRLGPVQDDNRRWLEVEDTGVGMSQTVLAHHLLDFGSSFWSSEHVLTELPELLASGFEPTGRFGIGFFSVFMWGKEVTVASRRHDAGKDETLVLEFSGGLAERPVLRVALPAERMVDPGTRVGVLLDPDHLKQLRLQGEPGPSAAMLARLCGWIAPSLDVTVSVEVEDEPLQTAVEANDWLRIPMDRLAGRIKDISVLDSNAEGDEYTDEADVTDLRRRAREMDIDSEVVGRACIDDGGRRRGVVTIGGFRSSYMARLCGVLIGTAATASRNVGIPLVPKAELARWASEQAELAAGQRDDETLLEIALMVRACGGETAALPIALTASGTLSREETVKWAAERDEVVAVHRATFALDCSTHGSIAAADNLVIANMVDHKVVYGEAGSSEPSKRFWPASDPDRPTYPPCDSLGGAVVEAVEEAWGVANRELILPNVSSEQTVVGSRDGHDVRLGAFVLRRPDSS